MIVLDKPIIVEGKYDKIKISKLVDTMIITTNGFTIFKNKKSRKMIRDLANKNGIVILTDSDWAGKIIRNHIKSISKDGIIYNAYIPKINGKERRKREWSKEGILGVEGLNDETIINALQKSGALSSSIRKDKTMKNDLYELGLIGGENSRKLRIQLLRKYNLPDNLSTNDLLDYINIASDIKTVKGYIEQIKRESK